MKISEHDRSVPATESTEYQESIHTVMGKSLLFIFAYITINMFHDMSVVFGLCLWWMGLALIANAVERTPEPENPSDRSTVFAYKELAIRLPR